MSSEPVKFPSPISLRAGFTMIELMVVVAIIVMASGVMGPTIIDFMKNRELVGIRGHFGKIRWEEHTSVGK
ncbi:MAG: type II secretion system protein, partial [Planctomycetota bacterium]|nr:type II secretion system protein [Planctomycetota bacterium]